MTVLLLALALLVALGVLRDVLRHRSRERELLALADRYRDTVWCSDPLDDVSWARSDENQEAA